MRLAPRPKHSAAWTTWRWLRAPYPYLDSLAKDLGETFRIDLAGFPITVFSNPEHIKEIFADGGDDLEAGRFNRSIAPLLGDRSVLMVDGELHRRKRKLLLPPFRGERMMVYGQVMLDATDDAIDAFPYDKPFSLHEPMQDVTLRVILRTVFGFDDSREAQLVRLLKRLLELGSWAPLLLPAMQVDLGRYSPYGRFLRAVEEADKLLFEEIHRRQATGDRGTDILSLLLDARDEEGRAMEPQELRDELVTLLVAGHETTATGLTWAMRWLLERSEGSERSDGAGHTPSSLQALRAELAALGPNPSPERIAKCELLDATAREALRLVPVIPLVGRVLARPRTIGGWDLRAGDVAVASIYLAHRRPESYREPERFDPTRHLEHKPAAHEFLAFGGGIRRCIGMAFALYEMKMVLARLVTRTELALEPGRAVGMIRRSITITPTDGLRVVMKRRRLRPSQLSSQLASA